jgi:hypothetical protein
MPVLRRSIYGLAASTWLLSVLAGGLAQAQQPSAAQTSAIRSNCRSDFMANCSGITPGGKQALDCLEQNLAKLSAVCQAAVSAIMPTPAAATAVPTAVAPAATAPAAPAPQTQPGAPPKVAKPGTAPAAKLTPAPSAPPPPAAAAAPAVAPLTPRPFIRPERRLAIVRMCRDDVSRLCAGAPPGGNRIIDCLAANAASLSPICYEAVARASR